MVGVIFQFFFSMFILRGRANIPGSKQALFPYKESTFQGAITLGFYSQHKPKQTYLSFFPNSLESKKTSLTFIPSTNLNKPT